jgi:hypothetical protein
MATLTELVAAHGFTAGDLDTSGYVAVIPAFQKVYFADGRTQANGGYHKLDFLNTRLVGTVTGTFTKGEVVTQATSGATGVFDETVTVGEETWTLVYRTTTTEFDTSNLITGADSGATLTPSSVVAPPHWLPWAETSGYEGLPEGGANAGCLHDGRIILNSMWNPNQWIAGRQGNPLDWLTTQTDVGSPVSSQTSKAGLVGNPIITPISYKDGYLLFGCENQMWVLRGDVSNGIMTRLSDNEGIFSPTSFCWDKKQNLWFVSSDGICVLTPDAIVNGGSVVNMTKNRLPNLFRELKLNRRTDRISMGYDKIRNGIKVSIMQSDGEWGFTLWLSLAEGEDGQIRLGIFPQKYADDKYRTSAMHYFDSHDANKRNLLCGCNDGYIRQYDEDYKSDDDTDAIEAWVTIGPMVATDKTRQRLELNEVSLKMGNGTDGITAEIYKHDNAEKVIKKIEDTETPDASKTFSGEGLQTSLRQRITGVALALVLKNTTADETFILEQILTDIKDGGKR